MIRRAELSDKTTRLPVKASITIERGTAVGDDGSGFARELVAADPFFGFALEDATGGSSDGDTFINVQYEGAFALTVASSTAATAGALVYASAKNTFTMTSTSNSLIGRQVGLIDSDTYVNIKGVKD